MGPRFGELAVLCGLSGNVGVQTGPRGLPKGARSNLRATFLTRVRKNIPIQGGSPPKLKTKGTKLQKAHRQGLNFKNLKSGIALSRYQHPVEKKVENEECVTDHGVAFWRAGIRHA